jgi:thiamine biosynthesis lipoprotein
MATPVTIMGVKPGLHMINQMKDIEAIIIDDFDKIHHSNNIRFN